MEFNIDSHPDQFICGSCPENAVLSQINDFLSHKANHLKETNEDAHSDSNVYDCQLCPQQFSRRSSLFTHYTLYHKLHGISKISCCSVTPISKKKTRKIKCPKKIRLQTHHGLVTKMSSSITTTTEANSQQLPVSHLSHLTDSNTYFDENIGDCQTENEALCNDFHFMLQHQAIKGTSLTYLKSFLACLYCTYKCTLILELVSHMQQAHADVVSTPVEDQQVPTDKLNVLRVSEYLQQTETMIINTQNSSPAKQAQTAAQLRCEFCHKYFTNKAYLKRHREQQHIRPKLYKCDLCDHIDAAKYKLLAHREKHLVKEFRCKECDFVSTIKVAIQSHRQIHSNGSYICDICGKAYKMKDTLQKHKRVHDKNRPFACTFAGCTLRFKTERMCRGHLKTHYTEGSTFRCAECGYSFRHKHHLKRHLENAHNIPFVRTQLHAIGDRIENFGIPESSVAACTKGTPTNDNETATTNLRSIILADESFDLATQGQLEKEGDTSSIMLIKKTVFTASTDPYAVASTGIAVDQTSYVDSNQPSSIDTNQSAYVDANQSGCVESNQSTSIFIPSEKDTVPDPITIAQNEVSHVILNNIPYSFESCVDSVVEVEADQITTPVEFVVSDDSAPVQFDESNQQETSHSLFS